MKGKILVPFLVVSILWIGGDTSAWKFSMDGTDIDSRGENHDVADFHELHQNETMELILYNDDEHVIISGILVEIIQHFNNGTTEIDKLFGPDDQTIKIPPGGSDTVCYKNPDSRRKDIGLETISYYNDSLPPDQQKKVEMSISFKVYDEDGNLIFEEKRFPDDKDVNYPLIILCFSVPIFVIAVLLILTIIIIRRRKKISPRN
jgi:hypothetical protein